MASGLQGGCHWLAARQAATGRHQQRTAPPKQGRAGHGREVQRKVLIDLHTVQGKGYVLVLVAVQSVAAACSAHAAAQRRWRR